MRTICSGLLAAVLLSAAVLTVQHTLPNAVGFSPALGAVSYTVSSTTWGAFAFVAPASPFGGTMRFKDIRFLTGTATGSPKITPKLYSDSGGVPGTLIETGSESAVITGSSWNTVGGFTSTSSLAAGSQYWIVLTVSTGTSVVVGFNAFASGYAFPPIASTPNAAGQAWGWNSVSSTDSGSTWNTGWKQGINGIRIGLTDGTDSAYMGIPLGNWAAATGATEKLYTNSGTSQEFGGYFTTPANAKLKIRGVAMFLKKYGTPSGDVRFRLYSGTYSSSTLIGTTYSIPGGTITTNVGAYYPSYFSSTITVDPGTIISVTANNTAADDSTNYFCSAKWPIDTDANSLPLVPFGGIQSIKNSGGSWSVTSSEVVPFWLLLDTGGEFAEVAGGGGGGGQSGWIYQQ